MDSVRNPLVKGLLVAALMAGHWDFARAQLVYSQVQENFADFTGDSPRASLLEGADGVLYGTMSNGGDHTSFSNTNGTVYRLNKDGSGFTVLWRFSGPPNDGCQPYGGLVQGSDGALYGTTYSGGTSNKGTVFKMINTGVNSYTNTVLKNFAGTNSDGAFPQASLLLGSDGWLYGTTYAGGTNNAGTVFKLRTNGTGFVTIRSFSTTLTDPQYPYCALIQGPNGLLYGTSSGGGATGYGTVFRLNTNGSGLAILKSFTGNGPGGDGYVPPTGLVLDTNGTLYGVTLVGGNGSFGNVFKLSTNGSGFQVLTNLSGTTGPAPGSSPNGTLIIGSDGRLYGTATFGGSNDQGVVFRLNRDGNGYTVLWTFINDPFNGLFDGANPIAGLVQGRDGGYYGTTIHGGVSDPGFGTAFSLGLRPVNDAFANRIPLAGPGAVGTGTNLNATLEANEQQHGDPTSPATNSVWWSWSGLSNGPVTIVNDSQINGIIDVYRQTTGNTECMTMPTGLVNWWAGEGSAYDSVGGDSGTLSNGVSFAPGKAGQAFIFAGTASPPPGTSRSNLVQIGASPIPPPWTAEFWVNRQDCPTNGGAVLLGDAYTALKLEQCCSGSRKVGFTSFSNTDYSFNYVAPAGTWVHLVFTGTSNSVSLYTNGVLQSSIAANNINLPRRQIGNDIVGRWERPVKGLVDEVSLYNRVLSASEIMSLYNAGTSAKCLPRIANTPARALLENTTSVPIPDNNSSGASSSVVVSNFSGVLGRVVVSIYVQHSRDSDLRLELISPEGSTCVLSANAGSSGSGFGTRCEGDVTTFDDFVPKALSDGTAPFVGAFRPSQPLSVFIGKSGAKVNGTWQLHAVDQAAGEVGSIGCWSLMLVPEEPPNRASFTVAEGTTYQVAVSGVINDSGPNFAGSGDISLSLRTLGLEVLSVTPTVNSTNSTTKFGALVQIGNGRSIAPAPLRLQFVAKPGYAVLQTGGLPPSLPPDQILTNYYLAGPSNVPPGMTTNVALANLVCPAPTNYVFGGGTNYVGWGVLVILQQQFGTNWLSQDSELVLYGVWPDVGGFAGPGGGVIRVNPTSSSLDWVTLNDATIVGTNWVFEGSTNYYYGVANFSDGEHVPFTNTVWSSTLPSIDGSGVFIPASVTSTVAVTLTASCAYDTTVSGSTTVWVINLPSPVLSNLVRLPDKRIQFTVKGVPGRKHVIQAATNLANPVVWTNIAIVTNNGAGTSLYIDAGATNLPRRFYRAYETP